MNWTNSIATNRNHFWDMMTSSSQDEKVFASPARPPSYKKIPDCDNPEDFANHSKENNDQNIPFQLRGHFDNVRQLYLKFMNEMGVSSNFNEKYGRILSRFFFLQF